MHAIKMVLTNEAIINIIKNIGFCFVVEGGKFLPMKSYNFSLLDSYVKI